MDTLVCVKAIEREPPRLRQGPEGASFERASASPIINECDDYAIDEAVRLKKLLGGKVRALTVGPLRSTDVLYQAVAKGADDALRIDCDTDDPTLVARLVAALCRRDGYDLVLTGVESADELASAVAPYLAALLDRPFATSVTRIQAAEEPGSLMVDKELGGGRMQRVLLPLPAVVAVQSGVCRLTYAPTARVLQARRMPPRSTSPAALGMEPGPRMVWKDIAPPAREREPELLSGSMAELAAALMQRIDRALRG